MTRKVLTIEYRAVKAANALLADQLSKAAPEAERIAHLLDHVTTELKDARHEIEMLQGKIDVITNQIELSATIISSYQAIEETRIAIATSDRVRALAEPTEERMQ